MAGNTRTHTPLCVLLSLSEVTQPWRVPGRVGKGASLGRTTRAIICAFAHAVRPRHRPRGQSRASRRYISSAVVGDFAHPTPQTSIAKKISRPVSHKAIHLVMSFGNGP